MALRVVEDREATARIRVVTDREGKWIHAGDLEAFFRGVARAARRQGSDVTAIAMEVSADEIQALTKDDA